MIILQQALCDKCSLWRMSLASKTRNSFLAWGNAPVDDHLEIKR